MGLGKTIVGGAICAGLGWGAFALRAEATHPGITREVGTDTAKVGANTMSLGGSLGGSALRATGPVIAGAKDAAQQSGIGTLLTPPPTAPSNAVPPPVAASPTP